MNHVHDLFQWFYSLSITNYILKSTCKKWEINTLAVYRRVKQKAQHQKTISKAWFSTRLSGEASTSLFHTFVCPPPHFLWKGQLLVWGGIHLSYKWHQWKSWYLSNAPQPSSILKGEKLALGRNLAMLFQNRTSPLIIRSIRNFVP